MWFGFLDFGPFSHSVAISLTWRSMSSADTHGLSSRSCTGRNASSRGLLVGVPPYVAFLDFADCSSLRWRTF